jgi:hypothetical protein
MMLEPPSGKSSDWTFVPDDQLGSELVRMRRFMRKNPAPSDEYRLNPAVFSRMSLQGASQKWGAPASRKVRLRFESGLRR